MNSYQLQMILRSDPYSRHSFVGVKPRDHFISEDLHNSSSYIINTDKSTQAGTHWLAIWITAEGDIEYFDSYGLPPLHLDIHNKISSFTTAVRYNDCPLQGLTTTVCGQYCLLFLLMRARGCSFDSVVQSFKPNLPSEIRDHLLGEFVDTMFGSVMKLYDHNYSKDNFHTSKARHQCTYYS